MYLESGTYSLFGVNGLLHGLQQTEAARGRRVLVIETGTLRNRNSFVSPIRYPSRQLLCLKLCSFLSARFSLTLLHCTHLDTPPHSKRDLQFLDDAYGTARNHRGQKQWKLETVFEASSLHTATHLIHINLYHTDRRPTISRLQLFC